MTTPTTVQVRFQFRADTAANWTSIDPILLANELGRETDTGKIKIGDGTTAWSSLGYQALGRISNADIATDAEIAVSKLANGTANQILTTDGTDVSWTDSPTIAGNVIISGNLTVNGTETIINVDTLQVEDKTIEMGNVTTPSDLTANNGGIVLKGSSDKTILWVDSTDSWTSSENVDLASGKTYKIAGTDVLSATTLGSGVTGSSLTSVGNLTDLTVDTDTLYVDATNNRVGVGTDSPAVAFEVQSASNTTIRIDNENDSTAELLFHNTGSSDMAIGVTNAEMTFRRTTSELMRLDSSRRLLVGASSFSGPTKLVVRGNSSAATGSGNAYLVRGKSSADMADNDLVGLIRFSDQDDNRCAEIRSSIDGTPSASASPGNLSFWTTAASATTPTQRMTIDSSGNVGIGNVSPSAPLQVQGSAGEIRIQRPTASQSDWSMKLPSSSGEYQIYDNNNTTARLTINSSGNVGIGVTSPINALHINGAAGAVSSRLRLSSTEGSGFTIRSESATETMLNVDSSENLLFGVGGGEVARIDSSGNVGIGTTNPTVLLDLESASPVIRLTDSDATGTPECEVSGAGGDLILRADRDNEKASSLISFEVDGTERLRITTAGTLRPGGDNTQLLGSGGARWAEIYAGNATINTSDANLKQDVENLEQAELNVATAIKALIKKYRFIKAVEEKGDDARIHVGVIAQDVEQAFIAEGLDPRRYALFCEDTLEDGTKRLGIRYSELLAFVIAAL